MGVVRAHLITCGEGNVVGQELQHIRSAGAITSHTDNLPQLDCIRVSTWRTCEGKKQVAPWNPE